MLVKARQWIRETFEMGSRPSLAEVQNWIEQGELPGRVIGGHVFVDADRFISCEASEAANDEDLPSGIDLLL